ncbi:MAG: hypothetical protein CSB13_06710 [Chloroflexi bacterium]|nr:MAG: hypothetical protein CSB13_06710 [Chloroflexota bacterium]
MVWRKQLGKMKDEQERHIHHSTFIVMLRKIFNQENLLALGLCMIILLLIIMTSDSAPQWIYQGF